MISMFVSHFEKRRQTILNLSWVWLLRGYFLLSKIIIIIMLRVVELNPPEFLAFFCSPGLISSQTSFLKRHLGVDQPWAVCAVYTFSSIMILVKVINNVIIRIFSSFFPFRIVEELLICGMYRCR